MDFSTADLPRQESRAHKTPSPRRYHMCGGIDRWPQNQMLCAGSSTEMSTTNRIMPGDTSQLINGKLAAPVNGHADKPAATAKPRGASSKRIRARAASVDAHGTPDAPAPAPPAAASATHDACADAACVSNENSAEEHVAKIPGTATTGSTA